MSAKNKSARKKNNKPAAPVRTTPAAAPRAHRPGLGRGLGALIGRPQSADTPAQSAVPPKQHPAMPAALPPDAAVLTSTVDTAHTVFDVPAAEISRSPWQPRQSFDEDALRELAESIKANGVIQPLVCRKNSAGRYELIAGERRLRAAIEAGVAKVPVVLVDAEDRRAAEMAIIENIQRQDLTVIEEAEGYHTLAESFSLTQQEVADRVGKARASVANALRLLELPDEVKQLVGSGLLSTGHAKVLLGLTDVTEQTLLGRKCVTEDLTVRSLEKVIRRRKAAAGGDDARRAGKPDLPESYVRDLCDRLHKHFGTAVRLSSGLTHANGKHTKGVLEIDFYDNDDLDRMLNLLGIKLD
ncbi:MAG: ParB/RepB/Spo0J family partition protein [Kiritimatiellae bacterium]|nr:ParB/RepB/Spo0J family partition protein [Kiritimatiellia bacterium]MDD3544505.1 ParB/RepB/Spo0J family partition protein [Kiritimatiellia bacterium]MDD4025441.1 ParB/RepB/Spo0J family partition protein [Kiritimatiellia bacterium]MDD4621655.1 ParB/RepB/Spo0J family partition protein [Kiritimatiellia bacterium]